MNKRLLVAALLICAVFSQCGPKSDLPNLQSGSVNFAVNSKGSSITTATFQQNFQSTFSQTPGVAFSLQAFNVNSPSISDWSVFTQSVQSNGFVAAFRHRPSEWTSVRVGFWASARPDLVVGAITAQFSSLKAGSAPVFVNLENGLTNPNTSISRAFLTGYTTKSGSEIFIRAFDKSISANRLQLGVQVGGNMQITSARVNYIVFSPSTAVFASYGGGVSQSNFSQSKLYNFQKFVHNSPYAFFGIANLRQSSSSKVTALNVRFDKDFYMRVDSLLPIQSFFLSYLVVGVNPSTSCSACNDKNIYENSCVAKCPDNSYQVVYRDGGKGCRMCPSQYNMVVNDAKTGCVCRSGFQDRNGLCVSADGSTQTSSSTQSSNVLPAGVTAAIVNRDTLVVRPVSTPVSVSASSGVPVRNTVIVSSSSSSSSGRSTTSASSSTPSSSAPIISSTPIFSAPLTDTSQSFIAKAPTSAVPKSDPEQFYVPNAPVQNSSSQSSAISTATVVSQPIISPSVPQTVRSQDCSNATNTYWTGYRCACRVGYALLNGFCAASQINSDRVFRPAEFIYKISLLYRQRPNNQCTKLNEVFNGQICDCAPGHTRGTQGDCRPDNDKCDNGNVVSGICVCNNGFEKNQDGKCVPISSNTCGENSYRNQFGQCICLSGFVQKGGKCVAGNTCPPYSDPDSRGVCQCWSNYKKFDGINCSRCPAGQIWLYGECTTTCGINEQANQVTGKCECNSGFGVYDGVCNNCPSDFFILDGYCVTCPLYAAYDAQQRKCVCGNGLSLVGGVCKDKCTNPNQVYSQLTGKCSCFDGLGRVGGICQICPTGRINPQTEQCISGCDTNEVLQGGSCNCRPGTGRDGSGKCSDCTQIQGGFLSSGFCVVCPKNQIPIAGKCGCEEGKTLSDGACISTCKVDQLVDDQGNCYTCPINEVLSSGKCNCRKGYQRIDGFCQIRCPANNHVVQERCVFCTMGTIFDSVLRQCVCPQGQYMNTYQVCEPVKKTCRAGTFLQGSDCVACSAGCSQCSSANTCTVCQNRGFYPSGPTCLTRCGDGIRAGSEACDDGNLNNRDGCSSSCTVQQTIPEPPQPPKPPKPPQPPTPPQDSGLSLIGTPNYNFNNVMTILRTSIPINGLTDTEKRSFIKFNFEDRSTEPSQAYCNQKAQDRFDCLFLYASGVPNKAYSTKFSYNYGNHSGSLTVPLNPLTSMINTRSLSPSSRPLS